MEELKKQEDENNIKIDDEMKRFIEKVYNLTKHKLHERDYLIGIRSLETELEDGKKLKEYLEKLSYITENLIEKNEEQGKKFLSDIYLYFIKCVGMGFKVDIYKCEKIDILYKDISKEIIDFAYRLESEGILCDEIFDVYADFFINEIQLGGRNIRVVNLSSIKNQPKEVVAKIDEVKQKLHELGNGRWGKGGNIMQIKEIIKKYQNESYER